MELGKLSIGPPKGNPRVLVMAGDNDPIASPASVRALATAYGVEPIILDGEAHDLFAGPTWSRAYDQLRAWLDQS